MIIDVYEVDVAAKKDNVLVVQCFGCFVSVLNLLIKHKKSDMTYSHIEFYLLSRFIGSLVGQTR